MGPPNPDFDSIDCGRCNKKLNFYSSVDDDDVVMLHFQGSGLEAVAASKD